MKKWIFMYVLLFASSALSSQWYDWDENGYCNEYDSSKKTGIIKAHVSEDICRTYQPVKFLWDNGGHCNEYSLSNAFISRSVDGEECRYSEGSFFRRDAGGHCNEYTPRTGSLIKADVSDTYCKVFTRLVILTVGGSGRPLRPRPIYQQHGEDQSKRPK